VPVYVRRLPHIYEIGRAIFVTWRLHGSLPPSRFFPGGALTSGRAFAAMDRLLDQGLEGRTGMPFWQEESYDHLARDRREFEKIRFYIENNPVRAGLVTQPDVYRWSSAWATRGSPADPGVRPTFV